MNNKTYCLRLENGSTIIKAKEINRKVLKQVGFIKLSRGKFRDTYKTKSTRNHAQEYVNMSNLKRITLD